MINKAKFILLLFLRLIFLGTVVSVTAYAGTFTGVTPEDIDACENRDRYDYCRVYNLLDGDEYTNDRTEVISALKDYFIDVSDREKESVDISSIEKTKEGVSNGSTNYEKRTDYLVQFSHEKYYGARTDCQIKLHRVEGTGRVLSVNENTLKCGEDLLKANFLGISKSSVVSHIRNDGAMRKMIGNYVIEQKKILDVLNEYFISRRYDGDSIRMKDIKETKSGVWHRDTKSGRTSIFTVKFEHRDRSPYQYDDCSVQVRTVEKRGGPDENIYWVASGKLNCDEVRTSPY